MPWTDIFEIIMKLIADCQAKRSSSYVEERMMTFDAIATLAIRRKLRKEGLRGKKLRAAMLQVEKEWEARNADGTIRECCQDMMHQASQMSA